MLTVVLLLLIVVLPLLIVLYLLLIAFTLLLTVSGSLVQVQSCPDNVNEYRIDIFDSIPDSSHTEDVAQICNLSLTYMYIYS